jgi:hypothetical protein
MNIIEIPEPPAPTPAQTAARALLARINSHASQLVAAHRELYALFWDSPATPDDILVEIGTDAATVLAVASQSVDNIAALAVVAGQDLHDILPPSQYVPRRPFVIAADGSATLETVEGLDAWGRPIPQPEPEPEQPPTDPPTDP